MRVDQSEDPSGIIELIEAQKNLNLLTCYFYHQGLIFFHDLSSYSQYLDYLKDLSLPNLKILKVYSISAEHIANLIENTKGGLIKINVESEVDREIRINSFPLFQNY
jgi:hypothetical protein